MENTSVAYLELPPIPLTKSPACLHYTDQDGKTHIIYRYYCQKCQRPCINYQTQCDWCKNKKQQKRRNLKPKKNF